MLKLSGGSSQKDRISFYTQDNGATAIRNKNGEITIEYEREDTFSLNDIAVFFGILSFFPIVKAFVLLPLIEIKIIGFVWYLIPTFFYFLLAIISIILVRKDYGEDFLKNHGAEHMVFSAYMKLKRIPTVEESKHFSRINRNCGITIYSSYITAQLIGFILYVNTSYIIPEVILFFIPLLFRKIFPFNFLGKIFQLFITSKPEKCNIELAIVALSALERKEFF